jgi:hypothetical protein
VDAGGEGEVRGAFGAGGVEGVRVLVGIGVPVGGTDQRDDLLAGAYQLTLELDWFQRDPAGPLDRRIPAQHLLDDPGGLPFGVGAQRLPLPGVGE